MSEFYKELRVDNGLRKIGVNDKGDYLEISINDSSVFDRFADLMTWLQEKEKDLNQFQKDHAKRTETYQECCKRLDKVFGEGCCRKVFGEIVPDELLIMDFIEQIGDVLHALGQERNRRMAETYNRRRKGANTKKPEGDV